MDLRQLIDRLTDHSAVIGVVGLGYVGLPLVLTYGRKGFDVIGLDIDASKVAEINAGRSYIAHIPSGDIQSLVRAKKLVATTDFARAKECDAILLCVPTPLSKNREPDMQFVRGTGEAIGPHLREGQLIVLESTTYPGTTDDLLRPILEERSGLAAGEGFCLAFSPEREDPANPDFTTQTIPKVVGGYSQRCLEAAVALYSSTLDQVVPVSSTRVAEMTKLFENVFRSVNIALVNETKMVCDRMGIDVWEVIEAAATKPFGFMPFYPGPGLGGHCIPVDPFYLTWKAREYDVSTRFIELAGEINTGMPRYVVERLAEALNKEHKPLNGAKILVLGVAYKQDVDDMRESPALRIIDLLQEQLAEVSYHDPHIPKIPPLRAYSLEMSSVPLEEGLGDCDAAVIVTAHTSVDYQRVVDVAPVVVDTRNATKKTEGNRHKITKA